MSGGEAAGKEVVAEKTTAAARRLRIGPTATDEGCGKIFLSLLLVYNL